MFFANIFERLIARKNESIPEATMEKRMINKFWKVIVSSISEIATAAPVRVLPIV